MASFLASKEQALPEALKDTRERKHCILCQGIPFTVYTHGVFCDAVYLEETPLTARIRHLGTQDEKGCLFPPIGTECNPPGIASMAVPGGFTSPVEMEAAPAWGLCRRIIPRRLCP